MKKNSRKHLSGFSVLKETQDSGDCIWNAEIQMKLVENIQCPQMTEWTKHSAASLLAHWGWRVVAAFYLCQERWILIRSWMWNHDLKVKNNSTDSTDSFIAHCFHKSTTFPLFCNLNKSLLALILFFSMSTPYYLQGLICKMWPEFWFQNIIFFFINE